MHQDAGARVAPETFSEFSPKLLRSDPETDEFGSAHHAATLLKQMIDFGAHRRILDQELRLGVGAQGDCGCQFNGGYVSIYEGAGSIAAWLQQDQR